MPAFLEKKIVNLIAFSKNKLIAKKITSNSNFSDN